MKLLKCIGEFIKWFLETQVSKEKMPIWREFFSVVIALLFVHVFVYQVVTGAKLTSEFMVLFSIVLGHYFSHKNDKGDNVNNLK